jgi:CRISPR-associated endonuclease Cas2
VVVAYDVADDGRRRRVAESLLDLTERVEYSVFDGWVPPDRVDEVWESARAHMRSTEDAAFVLVLCRACADEAGTLGRGTHPDPPSTSWIV